MYGTPKQVLSRVIQDNIRIGAIPETGMSRIFQTLSQHQDLLDKTNTFLNSFQTADQAETTMVLRQNAYDLYMMLPQTIINQTNKHLVKQGKQEWDVTSKTTGKQFYECFKLSIKIAYDQQMILMGHNTDNSMMSSVEKVFFTKNAGTGDDNRKKKIMKIKTGKKKNKEIALPQVQKEQHRVQAYLATGK